LKKQIAKINNLLIQNFGIPKKSKTPPDAVGLLIATVLSQNTNDKNSYKAFQNLRAKFASWEEVAKQPRIKIERIIKIAGLGKQKSKAIKGFLSSLLKKTGKVSLKSLKNKGDKEILEELTGYNGIGIKTASCVLLFSLRRNVCPVDTHVHRTLNRIGLVNTKSPDKTFEKIYGKLPEGTAHSFHTNLIRLGREICKPAKPHCTSCPLLNICKYENKNFTENTKLKLNSFMLLDNV
jgi:endonuclease III